MGRTSGTNDSRLSELVAGVRESVPFLLSCSPFAFACGLLGAQAGLSLGEIVFMAVLVYAGTAQFIGVSLIQAGAAAPIVVLSSLIVNLRYLLQGLSLAPFLSWLPTRWLLLAGFGIVDESYALTMTHYLKQGRPRGDPFYLLGSTGSLYLMWVSCNLAGGVLGAVVGDPTRWGLDFALAATFISLLMPQVKDARAWAVLLVAGATALAAKVLTPGATYLIVAGVAGSAVGVVLEAAKKGPASGVGAGTAAGATVSGGGAGVGTAAGETVSSDTAGAGTGRATPARAEGTDSQTGGSTGNPGGPSRGCDA